MEKEFNSFIEGMFPEHSLEDWIAKINKDLRSGDYQSLVHHKADGIAIQPAYTSEKSSEREQDFRTSKSWLIVEEILVQDEKSANRSALEALNRGSNCILFYLKGSEDIASLLEGIEIQYIGLRLVVEANPDSLVSQLQALILDKKLNRDDLDIIINRDPLENLARTGNWFKSEVEDFQVLESMMKDPGAISCLSLNTNLFANAGASPVQQLALSLSMAYETLHKVRLKNTASFWINFGVGSDYFLEIAKLRAFRSLWNQLSEEIGIDLTAVKVYAETLHRNKSIKDIHNNMIRSTSEAMAAIIGGADEVLIKSYDALLNESSEFGKRIARNQQHILQHESHLDEVRDIAKGSYFIETLTEEVATKAWDLFVELEEAGGFIEGLRSGKIQQMVASEAQREQSEFEEQKKLLVGVNKYAKEDNELKDRLSKTSYHLNGSTTTEVEPIKVTRLAEKLEKEVENA